VLTKEGGVAVMAFGAIGFSGQFNDGSSTALTDDLRKMPSRSGLRSRRQATSALDRQAGVLAR